jgi:hypothetical protein
MTITIISRLVDIAYLYSSFEPVVIHMLETKTMTGGKVAQGVNVRHENKKTRG